MVPGLFLIACGSTDPVKPCRRGCARLGLYAVTSDLLLRWMLIDPSYQDELDPEDYERCIASAMDVG